MRGLQNHSYIFSFIILLVLVTLTLSVSVSTLSSTKSLPIDRCDVYNTCGPYSYCDVTKKPVCNCIKGFDPKDPQQWELSNSVGGCVRRTRLSCDKDGFVKMEKIKLPNTRNVIVDRRISTNGCRERCLKDCNCTAFADTDIQNGGSGCVIWTGDLMDIRNFDVDGQDLHVKLAASELGRKKERGKITCLIIGVSIIIVPSLIMFICWIRKRKTAREISAPTVYEDRTPRFTNE